MIDDHSTKSSSAPNNYQTQSAIHDSSLLESGFSVAIVNFKKVSTFIETFIVYTIETTGNFRPFSVERRYNDFQWLSQRISERYPMAIAPPLPDKHNLTTIERFSGPFIDRRKRALEKFLQRMTQHFILGLDIDYWTFLTALPAIWNNHKRDNPVQGKVESLWQSIQSMSATASAVVGGTGAATAVAPLNSHSAHFTDNADFDRLLNDSIKAGSIMESLSRVVRRSADLWGSISKLLVSQREPDSNFEKWRVLAAVGDCCQQSADNVRDQLEPWIVESALYAQQVQNAARRRNDIESKFLSSISRQSRPNNRARDENAAQIDSNLHDAVSKNNADLRSELDQWRSERSEETRQWLKVFANLHIDHYKQTSALWRQFATSLNESRGENLD